MTLPRPTSKRRGSDTKNIVFSQTPNHGWVWERLQIPATRTLTTTTTHFTSLQPVPEEIGADDHRHRSTQRGLQAGGRQVLGGV